MVNGVTSQHLTFLSENDTFLLWLDHLELNMRKRKNWPVPLSRFFFSVLCKLIITARTQNFHCTNPQYLKRFGVLFWHWKGMNILEL